MTSHQFFIEKSDIRFPLVYLDGEEHHHLSKVLRAKPGQKVWLCDEDGTRYEAAIENIERKKTRLHILERKEREKRGVSVTLAQALLKPKKIDFIVQKATELGAAVFIPVITARSIIKVEDRIERKIERWRKIAREAAKQSRSSFIPSVLPPQPLRTVIDESREDKKLLFSERRGKYLKEILVRPYLKQRGNPVSSVLLLIGPEGGWTEEEEEDLLGRGCEPISLGSRILRAETAALSALAMITHFWNS